MIVWNYCSATKDTSISCIHYTSHHSDFVYSSWVTINNTALWDKLNIWTLAGYMTIISFSLTTLRLPQSHWFEDVLCDCTVNLQRNLPDTYPLACDLRTFESIFFRLTVWLIIIMGNEPMSIEFPTVVELNVCEVQYHLGFGSFVPDHEISSLSLQLFYLVRKL